MTPNPLKSLRAPNLIVRFMHSLGHQRDAQLYLDLFSSGRPESFAFIVASESVLTDDFDALVLDLRYLLRLGLFPVLALHTSAATWSALDPLTYFKKMKLKAMLLDGQLPLSAQVVTSIRSGALPVLHLDTATSLTDALPPLLSGLETRKLIFLNPAGALTHPETGKPISMINLNKPDELAFYISLLPSSEALQLEEFRSIFQKLGHRLHIAITSPLLLLRELFTVKGAGTLLYQGSTIRKYQSLEGLDLVKIQTLLESSFQKPLKHTVQDIPADVMYVEEAYQGAVFIRELGKMAYLSKYAVGLEARGVGVGRDLWKAVTADYPKIFWRASPENFIASWYAKVCDGMQKGERWNIYWIGLSGQEILDAIAYAQAQEEDFVSNFA